MVDVQHLPPFNDDEYRSLYTTCRSKAGDVPPVTLFSFGYKYNEKVPYATARLDLRGTHQPYWILKKQAHLTGLDCSLQKGVLSHNADFLDRMFIYTLSQILDDLDLGHPSVIAFGCNSGRHRSVSFVELIAKELSKMGISVITHHIHLDRPYDTTYYSHR